MCEKINEIKKFPLKLLILDVDGVLTDARVHYLDDASEFKTFNVRDGLGIEMLLKNGVEIAVISGRKSLATIHRMRDLGIKHVFVGVEDKLTVLKTLEKTLKIKKENMACIGDDIPDIPIMEYVGLSICVQDAVQQVRAIADYITKSKGGAGAVREICDFFL